MTDRETAKLRTRLVTWCIQAIPGTLIIFLAFFLADGLVMAWESVHPLPQGYYPNLIARLGVAIVVYVLTRRYSVEIDKMGGETIWGMAKEWANSWTLKGSLFTIVFLALGITTLVLVTIASPLDEGGETLQVAALLAGTTMFFIGFIDTSYRLLRTPKRPPWLGGQVKVTWRVVVPLVVYWYTLLMMTSILTFVAILAIVY